MLTEPLPIDMFVAIRFQDKRVARIVNRWPTEQQIIAKIIIGHFKEMGIYQVDRYTFETMTTVLINLLHSSPYVLEVVSKDREAESRRRQSRHSI